MSIISNYVEVMFRTLPETEAVERAKEDIVDNMEERFKALRETGMGEKEAFGAVISEFGNIEEIKRELQQEGMLPESRTQPESEQSAKIAGLERQYWNFRNAQYLCTGLAVLLFILSPGLAMSLDPQPPLLMFLSIAAGVGLLIYFTGRARDYRQILEKYRAESPDLPYYLAGMSLESLEREYLAFRNGRGVGVAAAVVLLILVPFTPAYTDLPSLIFLWIGIAVGILVYFSLRSADYRRVIQKWSGHSDASMPGACSAEEEPSYPAERKQGLLYGMLALAVVFVYLVLGFGWGLWHPGWLIFLLLPLTVLALEYRRIHLKEKEEKKS